MDDEFGTAQYSVPYCVVPTTVQLADYFFVRRLAKPIGKSEMCDTKALHEFEY